MEIWIRDNENAALVYQVHESEQTIFKKWAFDFYQNSPLGWVKIGKTYTSSSKKNIIQKLINFNYQKDLNQRDLYPVGDLLTL
jgi:hypothetical protein